MSKVDSEVPVNSLIITSSLAFLFGWAVNRQFRDNNSKLIGVFLISVIIVILIGVIMYDSDKYKGEGIEIALIIVSVIGVLSLIAFYITNIEQNKKTTNPDFDLNY